MASFKKINTRGGFFRNTRRSGDPVISFALGVPGKQGDLELKFQGSAEGRKKMTSSGAHPQNRLKCGSPLEPQEFLLHPWADET